MLLSNIVYQFFFSSNLRERRQLDPEKGATGSTVANSGHEKVSGRNRDAHEATSGAGSGTTFAVPEVSPDEEDESYLAIDEETDDNAIIRELEQEEYPTNEAPTQPHHRHLSNFTSFSTLTNIKSRTKIQGWWSHLKALLDPRTAEADLEAYVPHYRYLPIISGIVIPFSILLEIPGLTEDWYIRTEGNDVVDKRPNTAILDIALAFSIAFGVLANLCLIIRFMEKKVKSMTILCILFLTIHDILNIICVTVFGVEHRFDDGFTYGQAFWMTVCSTSVSTITNVTLIVDLIRTPDFSTSGSGLTRKQRTLVICAMALLTYIGFGALVQTFLLNDTFLNSLYFTVVSIETIGFGDIVPISAGGRVFTCLYSVFGILNLAVAVGLTRETVLEALEVGYRKRVRAVRLRRRAVQWEKRVGERWRAALAWRLREAGRPVWVKDDPTSRDYTFIGRTFDRIWPTENRRYFRYNHAFGHSDRSHPHGMHLNLEALSLSQLKAAAMEVGVPLHILLPPGYIPKSDEAHRNEETPEGDQPSGSSLRSPQSDIDKIPLTHARIGRMSVMLANFALAVNESSFKKAVRCAPISPQTNDHQTSPLSHRDTITEQYESARASMENEERRAFYARLSVVWILFIIFWMLGSGIFMVTEHWSFGTSAYFCFISFTTIGYGDVTPKTPAGRSVFIFWALLGVATMTILISILAEAYSDKYKRIFHSGAFIQAVKRYQERTRDNTEQHSASVLTPLPPTDSLDQPHSSANPERPLSPATVDDALLMSQKRVEGQLEALPHHVLDKARVFNEDVRYLIEPENVDISKESIPDNLQQLLRDVAGVERLGKIKQEILGDQDSRRTLLAISIENALRQLIAIAEDALKSLEERDRLAELAAPNERRSGGTDDQGQTSGQDQQNLRLRRE